MASNSEPNATRVHNTDPLHRPLIHANIPSVAIQKRWLPQSIVETTVHILAVGASVAILTICVRDTYFKDVQAPSVNVYLQVFQFVAKVHDVLVTWSLSELALCHLLHALCDADGVPLGYLLAPFQLSSPLTIFNREYTAALPSLNRSSGRWSARDWKTIRFASLTFFATIITAVISPLSAILIVPQLRWWDVPQKFAFAPAGGSYKNDSGFLYFNSSYDAMYPPSIGPEVVPSPEDCWSWSCPYYNMPDMYQFGRDSQKYSVTANVVAQEEANAARYLSGANNKTTFRKGYTASATPMSGLTRNHATLWLFAQRNNMKLANIGKPLFAIQSKDPAKPLMRPLVQVQCNSPIDISNISGDAQVQAQFRTDQIKLRQNDPPLAGLIDRSVNISYHVKGFAQDPAFTGPHVSFTNLSTNPTERLIGVLYSASFTSSSGKPRPYPNMTGITFNYSDGPIPAARALFPCSLVPYWIPTVTQLDPSAGNIVGIADRASPMDWTNSTFLDDSARPLVLEPGYMNAINALAPISPNSDNLSVFEYEFSALGINVYNNYWFDSDWSALWPALISTMASLQTADAIARYNHYADLFMWFADTTNNVSINLKDLNNLWYAKKDAPNQIIYGRGQEIQDHPELYTELDVTVQRFGYAWSLGNGWGWNSDALKRFAIVIILVHSMLVIAHHLAAFTRCLQGERWRCITWGTPLSILLLALQTPVDQVTRVRGTSTGVEDKRVYRDVALIREGDVQKHVVHDDAAGWENGGTVNAVLVIRGPEEVRSTSKSTAYHKVGKSSHADGQDDDIELGDGDQTPIIGNGEGQRRRLQLNRQYF